MKFLKQIKILNEVKLYHFILLLTFTKCLKQNEIINTALDSIIWWKHREEAVTVVVQRPTHSRHWWRMKDTFRRR